MSNIKMSFKDSDTNKRYVFNGTSKELKEFMKDVPTLESLMRKAKHQALLQKSKQLELF